jgi:6,7-dimethyl-8-ribityllumazine synthase
MQIEQRKKALDGSRYRIGIVKSNYNKEVMDGLIAGCLKGLAECGVREKNICVLEGPGSFELPIGAQKLAERRKYDGIICLGAIVKGETRHDEYIANACVNGLTNVALKYDLPVMLGVITALDLDQARARSGDNKENRGYLAALALVELLNNLRKV